MKCPGQDTQFWNADAIFEAPCPQCRTQVEFFKDDTTRKCVRCGHRFVNPRMDFGCAAYCDFAEQCLGDLPPELVAQKEDLFKDRVAIAVKRHLKNDFKRIGRAARRARHAEQICRDGQGDLAPVLMAAYLWELDERQNNNSGKAMEIMRDLRVPEPLVQKVCVLIGAQHGTPDIEGHRVVADAARIAELEDALKDRVMDFEAVNRQIDTALALETARTYARKVLHASFENLPA
ncbi:MAG: phosphohydrolase [Desulfatitalea sp.]|nr:phosphohydrolase [Desulfatitalea sp.]NNK00530.1 phosphohydrolase [Desulfatitalea sp.]